MYSSFLSSKSDIWNFAFDPLIYQYPSIFHVKYPEINKKKPIKDTIECSKSQFRMLNWIECFASIILRDCDFSASLAFPVSFSLDLSIPSISADLGVITLTTTDLYHPLREVCKDKYKYSLTTTDFLLINDKVGTFIL